MGFLKLMLYGIKKIALLAEWQILKYWQETLRLERQF